MWKGGRFLFLVFTLLTPFGNPVWSKKEAGRPENPSPFCKAVRRMDGKFWILPGTLYFCDKTESSRDQFQYNRHDDDFMIYRRYGQACGQCWLNPFAHTHALMGLLSSWEERSHERHTHGGIGDVLHIFTFMENDKTFPSRASLPVLLTA